MKKLFFLAVLICAAIGSFAQEHQNEHNSEEKEKHCEKNFSSNVSIDLLRPLSKEKPWGFRAWGYHQFNHGKYVVLDLNHGYISNMGFSAQVGYNFLKKNDLWLVPKVGFSLGDYYSGGLGLMFKMQKKGFFVLQNAQYQMSFVKEKPFTFFHFSEIAYGNHFLEGGIISELKVLHPVQTEHGEETEVEWLIGPSLRGTIKSFYLETWLGIEPLSHEKEFITKSEISITLGWKFNQCH